MFQINGKKQDPLVLPDAAGPPVTLSEKVYVPIKEYPDVSICNLAIFLMTKKCVSRGSSFSETTLKLIFSRKIEQNVSSLLLLMFQIKTNF